MVNNYTPPSFNLATGTKWYALIPINQINKKYKSTIPLNLYDLTFPEVSHGSNQFMFAGVPINLPNFVRSDIKEITISYLLSADWIQYRVLYDWFSQISNDSNLGGNPNYPSMDITIYVLSEYKKPMFKMIFKNCWVKALGQLDLNYQYDDYPIQHNFTISYTTYEFIDLIKYDLYE